MLADTSHSSDPTTAAQRVAATIGALPDVATVGKPVANPATHTALIQVIPDSAPSDPATKTLVNSIRDDRLLSCGTPAPPSRSPAAPP